MASVPSRRIFLVIFWAPSTTQNTRFKRATTKNHNAQRDDSLATASPSGLERECTTTPVRTPDTGKEQPLREREKGNEECRKEPISFCWKRGRRKG
jgi:hypothetical protein